MMLLRMSLAGSWFSVGVLSLTPFLGGCTSRAEQEVVVYAALDEEFSRPIFERFTQETGIAVRAKFDVESTKTVALTQAIMAERQRPRCDMFWNNEVVNTLRLEREGLLAEYESPSAAEYPEQYRSRQGLWYGFAARARVLVVNTKLVGDDQRPASIQDLADPKWKDRCGIAKPLAGTTATHAAVLFAAWGDDAAKEYFRAVKANARIMGGNKQVARAVAEGELAWGLTDTDDAIIEQESGRPVAIVFPDQGEEGRDALATGDVDASRDSPVAIESRPSEPLGTLMIPNTLAIIKGAPHRAAAERLVEYLLSTDVEERLAAGPSAQFPLSRQRLGASRAAPKEPLREMKVDFAAAAAKWDAAAAFLRDEFATAD